MGMDSMPRLVILNRKYGYTIYIATFGKAETEPIKMTTKAVYGRAESRNLSIRSHLPLKVVFHQRLSSIEGCLPLKVGFH